MSMSAEQDQQTPATASNCHATTRDGRPCTVPPVRGGAYCFAHRPGARQARARGGMNRSAARRAWRLLQGAPPELRELAETVHDALAAVRRGELDARRAQAIAALARVLLELHEQAALRLRLEELERAVHASTPTRSSSSFSSSSLGAVWPEYR
jgi:hypothetical protein